MPICRFCSTPAGPLRLWHRDCGARAHAGWISLLETAANRLRAGELDALPADLERIAREARVPPKRYRAALLRAWESTARSFLEDGGVTAKREKLLLRFAQQFRLERRELDASGLLTRLVKASVLRDLAGGKIPARSNVNGSLSLALRSDEALIWLFEGVRYFEERTIQEYRGGTSGISIRIVGGFWWRTGRFRGRAVETRRRIKVDTGALGVTNRALIFAGERGSFRVPYSRIVTTKNLRTGLRIDRDGLWPMVFRLHDARFAQQVLAKVSGQRPGNASLRPADDAQLIALHEG